MPSNRGQTNLWRFVKREGVNKSSAPVLVPVENELPNFISGMDYQSLLANNPAYKAGDALISDDFVRSASNAPQSPKTSDGGIPSDNNDGKESTTGTSSGLSETKLKELQNNISTIDVVDNFPWTFTESREEVPTIILKEKQLRTNSIIAQAAYYLLTTTGKVDEVVQILKDSKLVQEAIEDTVEAIRGIEVQRDNGVPGAPSVTPTPAASDSQDATENSKTQIPAYSQLLTKAANIANTAGASIKDFIGNKSLGFEKFGIDELEPYEALYLTRPTGFRYEFPYFENTMRSITNNFSTTNQSQVGADLLKGIGDGLENILSVVNVATPGTYIERSKFYQFPDDGEEFTFKFPLLNTTNSYNDVLRNWQLVFMLIYQNRPNRVTRDRVEPAVMYEVSIPGVRFSPYCFLSRLDVQFQGSRREMTIPVATPNGTRDIKTIIPEAYEVSITVKSLIGESRNLMSAMLQQDMIVTTNPPQRASVLGEAFQQAGNAASNLNSLIPGQGETTNG